MKIILFGTEVFLSRFFILLTHKDKFISSPSKLVFVFFNIFLLLDAFKYNGINTKPGYGKNSNVLIIDLHFAYYYDILWMSLSLSIDITGL